MAGFAFGNQLAAIADFTKNLLVIVMVRLPNTPKGFN
jgi:hypothetical protein